MEWQLIETIEDGEMLIYRERSGIIQIGLKFKGSDYISDGTFHSNRVYDATHWMPLPAPPAED